MRDHVKRDVLEAGLAVEAKRAYRRAEMVRTSETRQEADLEVALGVASECAQCAGLGVHVEFKGSQITYGPNGVLHAESEVATSVCPYCGGTGRVKHEERRLVD